MESIFTDEPAKQARVDGITMAYRVVGPVGVDPAAAPKAPRRPLLMVTGSSGTMDGWPRRLLASLAMDREVIVFDNRGMGLTTNPAGPYPFSRLADDTAGLVRALGYDGADVFGWSMGGSVVLDMAVRHPDAVGSIVSYAGSAGGSHAVPPTPEALEVLMDTSSPPEERGMRLLELLFTPDFRAAHPDYWRLFPQPNEETDPDQIGLQNAAIGEWGGVWDALPKIDRPALFVTGTEDIIAPPENATILADRVPDAWLVQVPGAGHGLMYQEPDRLASAVLTFLAASGS